MVCKYHRHNLCMVCLKSKVNIECGVNTSTILNTTVISLGSVCASRTGAKDTYIQVTHQVGLIVLWKGVFPLGRSQTSGSLGMGIQE